MTYPYRCQVCPECNPCGNPCAACQAGGICDGAFGQGCRCGQEDEPYDSDAAEYESELEP